MDKLLLAKKEHTEAYDHFFALAQKSQGVIKKAMHDAVNTETAELQKLEDSIIEATNEIQRIKGIVYFFKLNFFFKLKNFIKLKFFFKLIFFIKLKFFHE